MAYASSGRAGGLAEGVDITNTNRGTEWGYDQILKEQKRRTGRHGIKHLYM